MRLFPFDTQFCRASFILREGQDEQLIQLEAGTLEFDGPYSVLEYVIKDLKMERNLAGTNLTNSVSIEAKLGRRLLSVILTSFVPTVILVLVYKDST